jgi:hypothetical protein
MPYCNAFDRFNSPCLAEVPEGCDVCTQHTYFYGPQWFERFPFAPEPNSRMFFFSASSKIKAIYEKAIIDRRVIITTSHIKELEENIPVHVGVDYYLLCCMQDDMDPLSSPKFFTQAVKDILNCHKGFIYDTVRADPGILRRFLNPLLNTKYRNFGSIICHILYSAYRMRDNAEVSKNINGAISLIQEIKNHPKFYSEFVWEHSISEEKLVNILLYNQAEVGSVQEKIKNFFLDMRSLRSAAHEKQRLSFEPKKEEILALAWIPERFATWCLDTEEMARIVGYSIYGFTQYPATTENQRTLL